MLMSETNCCSCPCSVCRFSLTLTRPTRQESWRSSASRTASKGSSASRPWIRRRPRRRTMAGGSCASPRWSPWKPSSRSPSSTPRERYGSRTKPQCLLALGLSHVRFSNETEPTTPIPRVAGVLWRQCAQHRRREGRRFPHRHRKLCSVSHCVRACVCVLRSTADAESRHGTGTFAGGELGAGARGGRGAGEHPQHQGGAAGALGGRRRPRRGRPPVGRRGDHSDCLNNMKKLLTGHGLTAT